MHACGHDGYTAYLVVLADCMKLKGEIPGTIKIIHQHAEEVPPGGGKSIVDSRRLMTLRIFLEYTCFPWLLPVMLVIFGSTS
jgi:metal-dependent amidase/aminoacylase/carboxypeptidase family protein